MSIKLLDDNLINKIAAGEVIERPGSVAKELVENAIDSGADRIMVRVSHGGIDKIEVEDNGCGISGEELPLALQRHATSKISTAEDLFNISTLGFRGEALPSIASVSRLDIYSRKKGCEGVHARIEGGQIMELEPTACPEGTRVVINDLFYNTPVRKKFLKSPVSEGNHIHDFITKLALARPDISFTLGNENKTYFKTPGKGILIDAVLSIYGRDFAAGLIPVGYKGEKYSITGLVSTPEISRVNRKNQIFFINRRPIRSPMLYKAIDQAYKGLLISREFPITILSIDVPPDGVDVNVHPQKTEVRFKDEKDIFKLVYEVVRQTLNDVDYQFTGEIKPDQAPFVSGYVSPTRRAAFSYYEKPLEFDIVHNKNTEKFRRELDMPSNREEIMESGESLSEPYRIIGQYLYSYILVERGAQLWLVDQHAAHERINYARFKETPRSADQMTQILAIPITVQLAAQQLQLLQENRQLIIDLGFDIDTVGPDTIALRAAPVLFKGREMEIITEVLDLLEDNKKIDLEHEAIAMMACKSAVKAGQGLSMEEMEKIIKDLLETDNFRNCPHGRPTILSLGRQEIERRFKRL